jgi:phage-related protein
VSWKVKYYETSSGKSPVEEFVGTLQASTKAKLLRQVELLEEMGPDLGMPNTKPIGNGLFELRVRGREEVRSIYLFHVAKTIFVLHAFKKKTMAISRKDLRIARARQQEILNHDT